jgi:hypothetical protein
MNDNIVKMTTPNQIFSYRGSPSVKRLNKNKSENFTEYSVVQKSNWIANRLRIMRLPSVTKFAGGKTAPVATSVTT